MALVTGERDYNLPAISSCRTVLRSWAGKAHLCSACLRIWKKVTPIFAGQAECVRALRQLQGADSFAFTSSSLLAVLWRLRVFVGKLKPECHS